MKPIPQRTYTRNGTIFKTVDGVRRKFGKVMKLSVQIENQFIEECKHDERIWYQFRQPLIHNQLKYLFKSGYTYSMTNEQIVLNEDDYIHDRQTYVITFKRDSY